MPIEKTASVRLKPYLCTFILPFKIFAVKTPMCVERFEVNFLAIFRAAAGGWAEEKLLRSG